MNILEAVKHAASAALKGVVNSEVEKIGEASDVKKSNAVQFATGLLDHALPPELQVLRPALDVLIPDLVELALHELQTHHVFG